MKQACSSSDDKWRVKTTKRSSWCHNTWFVCVEWRKWAAPPKASGSSTYQSGRSSAWGYQRALDSHRKEGSRLRFVWVRTKTRWFFFSLSVWFIVHSVSENTRRKCTCVWHKGESKDKISELMIKREAAIRTVTLLPLKKNEMHTGQKEKKPKTPGYTTYWMCTVVLCPLPHLPQVIKYTSNWVVTGPVCCL